jgi:hypothetical protein
LLGGAGHEKHIARGRSGKDDEGEHELPEQGHT